MPYISPSDRAWIEAPTAPATPGELNYCVSMIVGEYIEDKGLSYAAINEAIGVLECSKLELYRRIAAPYEDRKIAENGDLPPYEGNT